MISHQAPGFFQNKDLRLILFGGKGGVGKTTMAAAAAIHLARSYQNDKRVLVISTDPAHSLGDSFGIHIGNKVTPIPMGSAVGGEGENFAFRNPWPRPGLQEQQTIPIPGPDHRLDRTKAGTSRSPSRRLRAGGQGEPHSQNRGNLYALELNAVQLLEEFKEKNETVIKKLAERGTFFDQQDIGEFFDLSLPGMDEVMAVIEIANLLRQGDYDVLILDTAPTGHTVRMLSLPDQMQKWIEFMDLMQHKHRYMFRHFTGKKYVKDECDHFLDNLSADIDRVKRLLSNGETTRFVPVMIPEAMSIYETKRLISSLERSHIPVKEIIVNRVEDSDDCVFCRSRREGQKQPLIEIEEAFSKYDLINVPVFPNEIRTIEALTLLEGYFLGMATPAIPLLAMQTDEEPQAHLALNPYLEFILFGGKGGVGKTSLAAAAALYVAQRNPEKKVLVFSTDPAHSLSDSFKLSIGDEITPIYYSPKSEVQGPKTERENARTSDPGLDNTNLFALEIDADRLLEAFKEGFKKDIEEVFNKFLGGGVDIKFDREVMTELLTLAPPGLDEIMALDKIMDLKEEGKFDIFVLDTSPTGHLLRFLELPEMARQWLKAFFRLLLKYRGIVSLTGAAEKALALSRNVRRAQESLADPKGAAFVAVTIPEAMSILELGRLMSGLENTRITCDHIIINMVVPHTGCDFCSSKRVEQQGYIKKIHSRFPSHTITRVPLFPHEVRGTDDLNKIGEIIFGNGK